MANKNVMLYDAKSPGCTWLIQGYEFKANMKVLKVLGVDWLINYSPILFYFNKIKISIRKEGRMIELKSIIDKASPQIIIVKKV